MLPLYDCSWVSFSGQCLFCKETSWKVKWRIHIVFGKKKKVSFDTLKAGTRNTVYLWLTSHANILQSTICAWQLKSKPYCLLLGWSVCTGWGLNPDNSNLVVRKVAQRDCDLFPGNRMRAKWRVLKRVRVCRRSSRVRRMRRRWGHW